MTYSEAEALAVIGHSRLFIVRAMFVQVIIDVFFWWVGVRANASGIYTRLLWAYCKCCKHDARWIQALAACVAVLSYGITGVPPQHDAGLTQRS